MRTIRLAVLICVFSTTAMPATATAETPSQLGPYTEVGDLAENQDRFGSSEATGDFNGDGIDDLAVGVPFEDLGLIGELVDAGGVNVIYGTAKRGLSVRGGTDDQFWTQDSPSIDENAESGDQFGAALAAGDFNADGYGDLAVGAPYEDIGDIADAGSVSVIYGSVHGLDASAAHSDQVWDQDRPGVVGAIGASDRFGLALTNGDFDGAGADDLVVSVPYDSVSDQPSAGAVNVLYGSIGGLSASGNQYWNQDTAFIDDESATSELFGEGTGAGDFNGDGISDLAIAAPLESSTSAYRSGVVHVVYGLAGAGLVASEEHPAQLWSQDTFDVDDVAEDYDYFGYDAVVGGDFNADGFDDLAIGVYGEDVDATVDAGAVNVIYGSAAPTGLSPTEARADQLWYQDEAGLPDEPEQSDYFGDMVAVGDFDGDSADDLAVGIAMESIGALNDAGAVNIIYGRSGDGLTLAGRHPEGWLHQGRPGMKDTAETGDYFGHFVATGDFNGSGTSDLAVGVTGEGIPSAITDAGAVQVVYGKPGAGLVARGEQRNQLWHQGVE